MKAAEKGGFLLLVPTLAVTRDPDVVAELGARSVLAIAIKIGAIGSMAFGLFQAWSGTALDRAVYSTRCTGRVAEVRRALAAHPLLLWSAGERLGEAGCGG